MSVSLCPPQVHIENIYGALPLLAIISVVYVGKFSLYVVSVWDRNHSNCFFPYPYRISCFGFSITTSLFSEKSYIPCILSNFPNFCSEIL